MRSSLVTLGITVLGVSILLAIGASTALAQHQGHGHHKMQGESQEITLVGEVLDLYCYMKHPANGQGAEHAKCAQSCIRKGLPIGLLADGEVYLIIGKEHESAKDMVVDFAGMRASLTGTLIEHDGVKAIEIEKIERVGSKSES